MSEDLSKKTPEQMKFSANEVLLESKGFVLICVNDEGLTGFIMDVTKLSSSEELGLMSLAAKRCTLQSDSLIKALKGEEEDDT